MTKDLLEGGRILAPADLDEELQRTPEGTLVWQRISPTEWRLVIKAASYSQANPVGALNFAEEHGLEKMRTDDYMKIIREGEED